MILGQPWQKSFQDPISMKKMLGMVVAACFPNNDRKLKNDKDSGPGHPGQKARLNFQNNQGKKSWRRGLSGRVPASQADSPEFTAQYCL
jgi:hypothetical protein